MKRKLVILAVIATGFSLAALVTEDWIFWSGEITGALIFLLCDHILH